MARKKLTVHNREQLKALARKLVIIPKLQKDYQNKLSNLIDLYRSEYNLKFTKSDIDVLVRHDVYRKTSTVRIRVIDVNIDYDERYFIDLGVKFTLPDNHCVCVQVDRNSPLHLAIIASDKACRLNDAAIKNKLKDYYDLINSSIYYEDVCAVWSEAEQLRNEIVKPNTSLIVLNPELVARIAQDTNERLIRDGKKITKTEEK